MPQLVFALLPSNHKLFLPPDLAAEFDVFTEGGWPSADTLRQAKKFILGYHPNRSIRETPPEVVKTWKEGRTRALLRTALSEAGRTEQRVWDREERYRLKREATALARATRAEEKAREANADAPRSLTSGLVFTGRTRQEVLDLEDAVDAFAQTTRDRHPELARLELFYDGQTDTLNLSNIAVKEGQRGQGVGTKVMQEVLEFARSRGLRTALTPEAPKPRDQARLKRFYKGLGFKKNRESHISESLVGQLVFAAEDCNYCGEPVFDFICPCRRTEAAAPGHDRLIPGHPVDGALQKVRRFKTDEGQFSVYDVEKGARGRADMFTVHHDPDGYVVRNALVPEGLRRQGHATELYTRMNQESLARTGKPLRSTQPRKLSTGEVVHELSPDAIALWESFVSKGLAEKHGEKNYSFKAAPVDAIRFMADVKEADPGEFTLVVLPVEGSEVVPALKPIMDEAAVAAGLTPLEDFPWAWGSAETASQDECRAQRAKLLEELKKRTRASLGYNILDVYSPKGVEGALRLAAGEVFRYINIDYDVTRGEELAASTPVLNMAPDKRWLTPMVHVDKTHAMTTDLARPVLFAKIVLEGEVYDILIDGHHRVYKALQDGAKTVPAHKLDLKDSLAIIRGPYAQKMRSQVKKLGLLKASMIDYPQATLPLDIFSEGEDGEYHVLPAAAEDIRKTVADILEATYIHPQRWVTRLLLGSSIASQFYNPATDVDVKAEVDVEGFKLSNPEYKDLSEEELEKVWDELMWEHDREHSLGQRPYEIRLRGTSHFATAEAIQNYDSLFDVTNDAWVKQAPAVDPATYERKAVVAPVMKDAVATAESWDVLFGDIRRNLSELDLLIQSGAQPDRYAEQRLAEVEKSAKKLVAEKEAIHDARSQAYFAGRDDQDYVNAHPDIVKMKLLVRWGYFDDIKVLAHYLEAHDDELIMADVVPLMTALENRTTLTAGANGLLPEGIRFYSGIKDAHGGELFGYTAAVLNEDGEDKTIGGMDWSYYDDVVRVTIIWTWKRFQRMGVATEVWKNFEQYVKENWPEATIDKGHATDEGWAFDQAMGGTERPVRAGLTFAGTTPGVLDIHAATIRHDPNLPGEGRALPGEDTILTGPKFDKLDDAAKAHVLAHEEGHLFEDRFMGTDLWWSAPELLNAADLNGQTTPAEIWAEAYAVWKLEPAWLTEKHPALAAVMPGLVSRHKIMAANPVPVEVPKSELEKGAKAAIAAYARNKFFEGDSGWKYLESASGSLELYRFHVVDVHGNPALVSLWATSHAVKGEPKPFDRAQLTSWFLGGRTWSEKRTWKEKGVDREELVVALHFNGNRTVADRKRVMHSSWMLYHVTQTLEHELRHRSQHRPEKTAKGMPGGNPGEPIADVDWPAYLNNPLEFESRLGDLVNDFTAKLAHLNYPTKPLPASDTEAIEQTLKDTAFSFYQQHMTPEHIKKLRQAIATAYTKWKAEQLANTSEVEKRLAEMKKRSPEAQTDENSVGRYMVRQQIAEEKYAADKKAANKYRKGLTKAEADAWKVRDRLLQEEAARKSEVAAGQLVFAVRDLVTPYKFWVDPTGEVLDVNDYADGDHDEALQSIFSEQDIECPEDSLSEQRHWALKQGWARVGMNDNSIYIQVNKITQVPQVLKSLSGRLGGAEKTLYVDDINYKSVEVPIDEGETVDQAWTRRASIRKRIKAGKVDELLKLAKKAVEDSPRWADYDNNPALATQLGDIQKGLNDARSREDLEGLWQRYAIEPGLDTLEAEAGRKAEDETPAKGKAEEKPETTEEKED